MKQTLMKILIFQLLSIITLNSYAQNPTWDYPIKPETEKWKSYQNTPDIVRDLQMPEKVLKSISMEELLKVCLKYPFLNSYIYANNFYEGVSNTIFAFNGFVELLERKDISDVFLKYYEQKQISEVESYPKRLEKTGFKIHYCAIELIICNDKFMPKFTREQHVKILKLILQKSKEKEKYSDIFGFWGKMTSAFVANRYAVFLGKKETEKDEKTRKIIKVFEDKMLVSDIKIVDNILQECENFAKTLK